MESLTSSINLSWDLFVLLTVAIITVYSVLMGRNRIVGILVNVYVALAVTLVAGGALYDLASNFTIISNRFTVTEFATNTILLVIVAGLLSIKSEIAGLDSGGSVSKLQAGIYGFFTAGVVLSSVFSFMTSSQLTALESNFANLIVSFQILFVVTPVVFMIGSAFIKKS
jgi:hypothetical protein